MYTLFTRHTIVLFILLKKSLERTHPDNNDKTNVTLVLKMVLRNAVQVKHYS